jgi:hypothetical protein
MSARTERVNSATFVSSYSTDHCVSQEAIASQNQDFEPPPSPRSLDNNSAVRGPNVPVIATKPSAELDESLETVLDWLITMDSTGCL